MTEPEELITKYETALSDLFHAGQSGKKYDEAVKASRAIRFELLAALDRSLKVVPTPPSDDIRLDPIDILATWSEGEAANKADLADVAVASTLFALGETTVRISASKVTEMIKHHRIERSTSATDDAWTISLVPRSDPGQGKLDLPEAPKRDPDYEACKACGGETHKAEHACVHCGAEKEWSRDPEPKTD